MDDLVFWSQLGKSRDQQPPHLRVHLIRVEIPPDDCFDLVTRDHLAIFDDDVEVLDLPGSFLSVELTAPPVSFGANLNEQSSENVMEGSLLSGFRLDEVDFRNGAGRVIDLGTFPPHCGDALEGDLGVRKNTGRPAGVCLKARQGADRCRADVDLPAPMKSR